MSCSQNTITPWTPIGTDYRLGRIYQLYTRTSQVVAEESPSSYLFQQSRRLLMKGWIGLSGTIPKEIGRR